VEKIGSFLRGVHQPYAIINRGLDAVDNLRESRTLAELSILRSPTVREVILWNTFP